MKHLVVKHSRHICRKVRFNEHYERQMNVKATRYNPYKASLSQRPFFDRYKYTVKARSLPNSSNKHRIQTLQ